MHAKPVINITHRHHKNFRTGLTLRYLFGTQAQAGGRHETYRAIAVCSDCLLLVVDGNAQASAKRAWLPRVVDSQL